MWTVLQSSTAQRYSNFKRTALLLIAAVYHSCQRTDSVNTQWVLFYVRLLTTASTEECKRTNHTINQFTSLLASTTSVTVGLCPKRSWRTRTLISLLNKWILAIVYNSIVPWVFFVLLGTLLSFPMIFIQWTSGFSFLCHRCPVATTSYSSTSSTWQGQFMDNRNISKHSLYAIATFSPPPTIMAPAHHFKPTKGHHPAVSLTCAMQHTFVYIVSKICFKRLWRAQLSHRFSQLLLSLFLCRYVMQESFSFSHRPTNSSTEHSKTFGLVICFPAAAKMRNSIYTTSSPSQTPVNSSLACSDRSGRCTTLLLSACFSSCSS